MDNILILIFSIIKYLFSKTKRYLNIFFYIIKFRPKTILEVGVYKGTRSFEMITAAKIFNNDIYFYGFDLFEKLKARDKIIELSKYPYSMKKIYSKLNKISNYVKLYRGNTKKTLKKKLNKKIDFIFIDGGHSIETIKSDWNNCKKFLNKKTIIILDDYYINNKEVIKKFGCNSLVKNLSKNKFLIKVLPFTDYFKLEGKLTGIKMILIKQK